jgi:hypothetical protein
MIGLGKYISRRFKEHHTLQMCINSTDDDFNFRSKPTTLEPGSPSEKTGSGLGIWHWVDPQFPDEPISRPLAVFARAFAVSVFQILRI